MAQVECRYHNVEVLQSFPGFTRPPGHEALVRGIWDISVDDGSSINAGMSRTVALKVGMVGCRGILLMMSTYEVLASAARIEEAADCGDARAREDAKDEDEG